MSCLICRYSCACLKLIFCISVCCSFFRLVSTYKFIWPCPIGAHTSNRTTAVCKRRTYTVNDSPFITCLCISTIYLIRYTVVCSERSVIGCRSHIKVTTIDRIYYTVVIPINLLCRLCGHLKSCNIRH